MESSRVRFTDFGKTDTTTVFTEDESPVISDASMHDINIYVNCMLRGSFALFGAVNNIINMIIFYRLGLKEGTSVCLMALSFTDFVLNFLGLAGTTCYIWVTFSPKSAADSKAVDYVLFGWPRDILFLCSGWITTVLSIERCVCVVFPFKVKQIFTRFRCLVIVIIIYVVHIAVHMPVFLSQWLGWTKVEEKTANGTVYVDRLIVMFSDNRDDIQMYIDIANGVVLPIPSQALVIVSVILMAYGLRMSRKRTYGEEEGNNKKSNLSLRQTRFIKVVIFLAVILTLCNIPRFIAVHSKHIFPEVSLQSRYENLYVLLWYLSSLASIINSSVNIFIYMIVNTKYRMKFKELFKIKKTSNESDSSEPSVHLTKF